MSGPGRADGYVNPVLDRDFPDPNVIRASDGAYYAYATQGLGEEPVVNIQVARSADLVEWEYLGDALPAKPPWASGTQDLWAPHVLEHRGRFLMYFSAQPDDPPVPAPPDDPALCLALAVADRAEGPFADIGRPLFCGPTTSDIDPATFEDPRTGEWLLVWGSGGDIVAAPLPPDLLSLAGEPRTLLLGWTAEPKRPLEEGIEGPYVVERDGWYYLWYSGDRCWTWPPRYAPMVARSRSPWGPYRRLADALGRPTSAVLGDNERWRGPGHNSVVRDEAGDDWIVYHAIDSRQPWLYEGQVRRPMLIDRIEYRDGWPVVGDGTPSVEPRPAPAAGRGFPVRPGG